MNIEVNHATLAGHTFQHELQVSADAGMLGSIDRILAAQSVIDMFLDEESQSLAQLGDFIAKPISLQVETVYTQEQYDVVLI